MGGGGGDGAHTLGVLAQVSSQMRLLLRLLLLLRFTAITRRRNDRVGCLGRYTASSMTKLPGGLKRPRLWATDAWHEEMPCAVLCLSTDAQALFLVISVPCQM
jgi:hypothetical protein